ncbi:hypothetical protein ACMDCR_00500 [Labrys okinawensis]|uniref:hypothetical protein n=1 Tax=Labrys okinawensis TaxID=346911 RepID=UPI0039BC8741
MATLGILCLSNRGVYIGEDPDFHGGIADPARYNSPPLIQTIPGAWTTNVVPGHPEGEADYVAAAQQLVLDGADAITCDCGFTLRYQQAIASAVSVPVSTSSLLLLPMLLRNNPASKKIAVLTYDTRYLTPDLLKLLGIDDLSRLVIEGLEHTKTYDYMWAKEAKLHVSDALSDTDAIIERLKRRGDIAAVLCECTFFARVSRRIRRETNLPVYDVAINAALLMAAVS